MMGKQHQQESYGQGQAYAQLGPGLAGGSAMPMNQSAQSAQGMGGMVQQSSLPPPMTVKPFTPS